MRSQLERVIRMWHNHWWKSHHRDTNRIYHLMRICHQWLYITSYGILDDDEPVNTEHDEHEGGEDVSSSPDHHQNLASHVPSVPLKHSTSSSSSCSIITIIMIVVMIIMIVVMIIMIVVMVNQHNYHDHHDCHWPLWQPSRWSPWASWWRRWRRRRGWGGKPESGRLSDWLGPPYQFVTLANINIIGVNWR